MDSTPYDTLVHKTTSYYISSLLPIGITSMKVFLNANRDEDNDDDGNVDGEV